MPMANPTFMFGPKDGGRVPDILWALDVIHLREKDEDGKLWLHIYALDDDSKNYYYQGVAPDTGDHDDHEHY